MTKPELHPGDWVLVRKHCGTTRTQVIKVEDDHAFVHYVCRDEEGRIYDIDGWVSMKELEPFSAQR